MGLQLTLFFALTFLVLAGNAVMLLVIRKALRRTWNRFDSRQAEYRHIGTTLVRSLHKAEAMTGRLAEVTGSVRDSVETLDGGIRRPEDVMRYGLAKADFNADRISQKLLSGTRRIGRELHEPLYRTATIIHGARAILEQIARWQGYVPHSLRSTARVVGRLDTAATVIQAITALGEMFRSRRDHNGSAGHR